MAGKGGAGQQRDDVWQRYSHPVALTAAACFRSASAAASAAAASSPWRRQEDQVEQDSYHKAQQQVQMPVHYGEGMQGDAQAVPASGGAPGYPPV
jgi:hypothetical protein